MPTADSQLFTDQIKAETLHHGVEMTRIGSRAVSRAQEQSRQMGVPNVYPMNGQTLYELPDGTIVTEDPWHGQNTPPDDWPWRDRWEATVGRTLRERTGR